MYQIRKFSDNYLNLFFKSAVPPVPPTLKEVEIQIPLPSFDCDCVQEGWKVVMEVLNNEDMIWLLTISGFFATLFLWFVTVWLEKRREGGKIHHQMKTTKIRSRKISSIPQIAFDFTSEEENEISKKSKPGKEKDCGEDIQPVNLNSLNIIGDHPDKRTFSSEDSRNLSNQNIQEITNSPEIQIDTLKRDIEFPEIPPKVAPSPFIFNVKKKIKEENSLPEVSTPFIFNERTAIKKETISKISLQSTFAKSPEGYERSSLKGKTSKSCNLRVDPIEYRNKRLKRSNQNLNVAFGSRLSTPRIGDLTYEDYRTSLSGQISPALTSPSRSLVGSRQGSRTNVSLRLTEKRPNERIKNNQEAKVDQISSTSSENANE